MIVFRGIGIAVLFVSLSACAYEAETVAFPYAAPAPAAKANPSALPFEIVTADRRPRQDRFSSKTDAYGREEAPISSTEPVTDIIGKALSAELQARGFAPGKAGVHIDVAIRAFYTRFTDHHDQLFKQDTADARVELDVAVSRDGRALYTRVVSAHGSIRAPTQRYWGGTAASVLSDTLKEAITQLVDDPTFHRMLERPTV